MKVIDVINKIYKGSSAFTFRTLWGGHTYKYIGSGSLLDVTNDEVVRWIIDNSWLNEEVVIIEEVKKIEKVPIGKYKPTHRIKKIEKKLNELIDEVNKLKDDNK